ncbi:MAG: hypothetical protein ACLQIQ_13890 [Beijerinckiaceae bacterium]
MSIIFLQTSDRTYRPLLETTSKTVREYCGRHNFSYESYLGIIRGYHPWHATYNRIALLERLVQAGILGWVCYLDADAFIADLDFDLRNYLADKNDFALIAAPGGPPRVWWNVNAGVFLINLGNPVGRQIIRDWAVRFAMITDEQLQNAEAWGSLSDDQGLLYEVLQNIPDGGKYTLVEDGRPRLLNYDGRFIKQVLRVSGTIADRLASLNSFVEFVLKSSHSDQGSSETTSVNDEETRQIFVRALYRVLLRREPDPEGFQSALDALRYGMSFEEQMTNCLRCAEFGAHIDDFIRSYVKRT